MEKMMKMTDQGKAIRQENGGRRPEGKGAGYDKAAQGVNRPIYDYYAGKIKEKSAITQGFCLDVGANGGYLGLALARITNLDFTFLDISAEALEKAKQNIVHGGLGQRAKTLHADVHDIPLPDGSIQMVISRGSIPFWDDPVKALKEIYRVLAPGGEAWVICGRGTPEIQAAIEASGGEKSGDRGRWGPGNRPKRDYEAMLKQSGVSRSSFNRGDDGMWIRLWK